ncbi:MAG: SusD/RagB family nutrient-binding outer membrane lipoprotein [Bacteroidota bacterium]
MKKINIVIAIAVLMTGFLTFNSCTKDFEAMNVDPNLPNASQAAPDMLLTNAIESMTSRVYEIFLGHEMGSCWAQQMAKVQYTDEDRYIPRLAVINNTWTSFYSASGMDVRTMYDIGVAQQNLAYQGVGLVLESYITSVLTDLFGPVPYSQAWKGASGPAGLLPKYDSQEDIYRAIIAKLETANKDFNDNNALVTPKSIGGDILFGNDLMKWQKFANSLKLRLILRMSAKDAAFAGTEMKKVVNDPANYPVFTSSADNAALAYLGSAPNNNPINENRKTRDDHRVSKNFIDLVLNTYGDYRIMVFANPSKGNNKFEGLPNGLTSAKAAAFNGGGLANTSKMGDYFTAATSPGQLMSYAELQFILAEATVSGFLDGGMTKAKEYYVAGVTGSFDQFRAPLQAIFDAHSQGSFGGLAIDSAYTVDAELNWHMTNTSAPAYFDEAAITTAHAYELIRTERYIATFDQGLQSWFEWRRTRTPVLTPAEDGVLNGKIPTRVTYPTDEYVRNRTALDAGVGLLGQPDLLTSTVWWDVN